MTPKAVRFASSPPKEYRSTLFSVEDMTDAVWYRPSEGEAMIQGCKLVAGGKIEDLDCDGCSSSLRGLEIVSEGSNEKKRHQSIVTDILEEQKRQIQEMGFVDAESLGRFAKSSCLHRQRLAEIRGKQDEMEASDSGSAWSISGISSKASPIVASPKTLPKTVDREEAEHRKVARRQARRRMGRLGQHPARASTGGCSSKRDR